MNRQTQVKRFQDNWEQSSPLFGKKKWNSTPDFLFFIEIPLSLSLVSEMETISENLKNISPDNDGLWIPAKRMRITLALPGRMGLHFQGNDLSVMKRELKKILKDCPPFEIQLGNINCFPNALFREVLDEDGDLFDLHKRICTHIPFSQNPKYQFDNFLPHISFYYGDKNKDILTHPEFVRELPQSPMKVDRIFFGKAITNDDEYNKQIVEEFLLQ